jgi:hypothetical protein
MDVRDYYLIKQYGEDTAQYLLMLAKDPTIELLDQIKYSEAIGQIRKRLYFKSKLDWNTCPYQ